MEGVSWFDCVEYCNALSEKEGLDPVYVREGETVTWDRAKIGYRLPTEAEWEFACRAGSGTAFCNGEITELWCEDEPNLAQVGWYCANAAGETQPVKGKEPNAWGLHDMHGNVWEWCWDFYDIYPAGSAEDPAGAAFGLARVFRGGSWTNNARLCRSAYRYRYIPEFKHNTIGFRVCMTAP